MEATPPRSISECRRERPTRAAASVAMRHERDFAHLDSYCTVKATLAVCDSEPLVAVTVML